MNQNIKLTYIVDFLRTVQAGTEKQLAHLLTHLPREGYSLRLISFQDSEFLREYAPSYFPDVSIHTLGAQSDISRSLPSLWRLFHMLRDDRSDIVHTFFTAANSLGVMIARLAGIPCVVSSRRDMAFNLTRMDINLLKCADRFVSCVICNARAVRDKAVQLEGLSENKTRVIYNGITPHGGKSEALTDFTGKPVIGIVANLNREVKRVDLFVNAAARLHQSHPEAVFWVIGDGHLRPELEALGQRLGLDGSIVFHGRRSDVADLLPQMRIGVICSDSEGFSNAVMEYMIAGLPVVATNSGGTAEIVLHGRTGLLTPPGDVDALVQALRRLLDEPETTAAMGRAGAEAIGDRFTIEKMVDATSEVYRELLAS